MRNLLAFVAALALGFAGVGWYLGWYKIDTSWMSSGHFDVHADVDTKKIADDAKKAEDEAKDVLKKQSAGTQTNVESNMKNNVPAKTTGNVER